jgi:hypothetical protein
MIAKASAQAATRARRKVSTAPETLSIRKFLVQQIGSWQVNKKLVHTVRITR